MLLAIATRVSLTFTDVATVPLAYLTLRALDYSVPAATLASLFSILETGMIIQSLHIFPDSSLVFFTALTAFV